MRIVFLLASMVLLLAGSPVFAQVVGQGAAGSSAWLVDDVNPPAAVTASGTVDALNEAVTLAIQGRHSLAFHYAGVADDFIVRAEASYDEGTTWTAGPVFLIEGGSFASLEFWTAADGIIAPIEGATHVRVRVISYTAGSATISLRATATPSSAIYTSVFDGQSWIDSPQFVSVAGAVNTNSGVVEPLGVTQIQPGSSDNGLIVREAARGQAAMAASIPVVVASNQTAIPVTDNGGALTVDGTVTVTATDLDIRNLSSGSDSVAVTVPAPLSTTGGGTEAAALRVTLANDSSGLVSVDDNGGSLTVDGTVTVTDGAGAINVICDSGCTPGGSFEDNDPFTFNTTAVNVGAGVLDDTGPNAATENSAAAFRISANRMQLAQIGDGAGNERRANVTAGNALVVDGSASTQPVSGTVTANAGSGTFVVGDGAGALNVIVDSATLGTVTVSDGAGSLNTIIDSGSVTATLAAGSANIGDVDVLTVPAPLSTTGGGTEATALRVTLANDSTGVVSVDDNGSSLTVDGTVAVSTTAFGITQSGTNNDINLSDGTDTALVSGSGSLQVTCDNCGGAAPFEDNDAFTPGTSSVAVGGFEVDDTGTSNVTENSAGAARMTPDRAVHNSIRDSAGNNRGANVTAGNALVVDASATTQPISAASLPLPTGAATSANQTTANTSLGTIAGAVSGTEMQVDVLTLPAVALSQTSTNNDVDVATIAAGDTNIGNVDIVTMPSVTIGTFPDNEPINVAQMNGVTVTMGNGASGTGVQRVTLASDSTGQVTANAGTNLNTSALLTTTAHDSALGTAGSADAQVRSIQGIASMTPVRVDGQSGTVPIFCTATAFLNMTTATTTQIVALSASTHIYVCSYAFKVSAAADVRFVSGTGSNCATSPANASVNFNFTQADAGINRATGGGSIVTRTVDAGDALCVTSSAATDVDIEVSYAQF